MRKFKRGAGETVALFASEVMPLRRNQWQSKGHKACNLWKLFVLALSKLWGLKSKTYSRLQNGLLPGCIIQAITKESRAFYSDRGKKKNGNPSKCSENNAADWIWQEDCTGQWIKRSCCGRHLCPAIRFVSEIALKGERCHSVAQYTPSAFATLLLISTNQTFYLMFSGLYIFLRANSNSWWIEFKKVCMASSLQILIQFFISH